MKWLGLFAIVLALSSYIMVNAEQDYTKHYAELASPVPDSVNVDDMVSSLLRAGQNV